jgi:pimeloyl-ACP methyl ester carboxylesterase
MTPQRLAINGVTLAVHDDGGPGMRVVFQHGLCGDARQTAEAFPQNPRFRRITLECRGHGASGIAAPLSIAAFADDLAVLIETLRPPLVIGGISMGAAIAVRLAVIRPDLVRGLCLVRPAWVTGNAPPNMRPNAEVGHLLATLATDDARTAFMAGATARMLAKTSPDNLASLTGFFGREPQAETARLLQAISADGPGVTAADLAALTIPVLVCGTSADAIHPLAHAESLCALIPHARLVKLPAKGHDKPAHLAALHAALTDFLKEF